MTGDGEKLRQTLDQLHQQLAETESLEPAIAARLRATIDDIRIQLDRQGLPTAEAAPTAEQVPTEETAPGEETTAARRDADPVVEPVAEDEATDGEAAEPTFAQRLAETEQYFQSSHPTLSNTLQRLVDVLAQLGI